MYIGHSMGNRGFGTPLWISGCDVVQPDRVIPGGVVIAAEGRIAFAGTASEAPTAPVGARRLKADGLLATPALWEMHIHGCAGISTEQMTPDSLKEMAGFLAGRGVGAFLPTVVPHEQTLADLGQALDAAGEIRGRAVGIHVEGPFVSPSRRGAIPPELLRPPSKEYLDRMVELTRHHLRVLTIAPELTGAADLIARLPSLGVLPSLGHSDASFETVEGLPRPAPLSVTHLFNGMSGVSHKSPGLAQWALLDREVYTELNCDGAHVHDAAVRLALRLRPGDRVVVISDAVAPAGLPSDRPPGSLYGAPLTAKGAGLYYRDSGVLVGSRFLVMDELARLIGHFGLPVAEAVAMATANPARLLGYAAKGALRPGLDADIALFEPDFSSCRMLAWQGGILHDTGL